MQEASFFLESLRAFPLIRADFVERVPGLTTSSDKAEILTKLRPHHEQAALELGFQKTHLAEQIHGDDIAIVTPDSPLLSPGVDALISNHPLLLGIHVADCGAVYLLDSASGAIGLIHSGKKGTEFNITGKTIRAMTHHYGTRPADLIAVLGPCIRPPHYEVDFASTIQKQALEAGIPSSIYRDCGLCTATDLDRFYSYRIEEGNTGRHLALLGRLPS